MAPSRQTNEDLTQHIKRTLQIKIFLSAKILDLMHFHVERETLCFRHWQKTKKMFCFVVLSLLFGVELSFAHDDLNLSISVNEPKGSYCLKLLCCFNSTKKRVFDVFLA